jgi:5-methylcytosine-specific restriction endonuclease McrA
MMRDYERRRYEYAKRAHATMLARTDDAGRPLYRLTSGGNVVRTRPITQRLKAKILNRDGHACVECGATATESRDGVLHIAHIEDYRVNGNNDPDNLRTLCPDCHAAEARVS